MSTNKTSREYANHTVFEYSQPHSWMVVFVVEFYMVRGVGEGGMGPVIARAVIVRPKQSSHQVQEIASSRYALLAMTKAQE